MSNNSFLSALSTVFAALLIGCNVSYAQVPTTIEIDKTGVTKTVSLTAADSGTSELQFWFISQGQSALPLSAGIIGPAGSRAQVEAHQLTGAVEQTLASAAGWYAIKLDRKLEIAPQTAMARRTIAKASSYDCSAISEAQYRELEALYASSETPITRAEICQIIMGGDPGSGASGGGTTTGSNGAVTLGNFSTNGIAGHGIVHKDTCAQKTFNRYLVRMRVNLTGIDRSAFTSGFDLQVAMREEPYKGRKSASLKPRSDGKFAPNALALMCSLQSYSGVKEYIEVYRWKNGLPAFFKKLIVQDYAYSMGKRLTRAIATPVLVGGKGTFELTNENMAYSVCFKLVRKRQNVNGY